MIGTHTRLYSEEFDSDRTTVVARAKAAGITHCFIPTIDSIYTDRIFALKDDYPDYVFLMDDLYPCNIEENCKEKLAHIENSMFTHHFCAIDEVGADLCWNRIFLKEQQEVFT